MNPGVFSLILFLVLVAVSYFTSINCGLLSMAGAIIIGRVFGLTDAAIYGGVNLNVFITMLGMFIYSAVLISSGTLELFARKFLNLIHVGPRLWPIVCYLFTCAFANCGPASMGCIILPIVTMSIGKKCGSKALPVGIITALGGISAFGSPISDGGAALYGMGLGAGLTGNIRFMAWIGAFLSSFVCAVFVYLVSGCWKQKAPEGYYEKNQKETLPKFTKNQVLCLLSLPVFIITFVLTGWHVGLVVCIYTVLLIGLKAVDQRDVLAKTSWGAIVLVVGTGIYMTVCKSLGGVDVLAQAIERVSNAVTVSPIYCFAGGFLSFFSYALAVPIPSLAPTIIPVMESLGISGTGPALATYSALIAGAFIATMSPMSFSGACVLGHWSTLEAPDEATRSRAFTTQLLISIGCLVVASLFSLTGVLNLFV
jgi:di/tricarboxylate transporter